MNPKKYFLSNKTFVSAHNSIVEHPEFRISSDYALLQLQENLLGQSATGDKALANYHRMEGARLFLQTFTGLGVVAEKNEPQGLPPNLKH